MIELEACIPPVLVRTENTIKFYTCSIVEIELPANDLSFADIPVVVTDSPPVVVEAHLNSTFILKVTANKTSLTVGADAYVGSWRMRRIRM